jgi:hypothetical protein
VTVGESGLVDRYPSPPPSRARIIAGPSGLLTLIQSRVGPDLQGGGSGGPYPARPHDQHRSAGFRRQQGLHVVCRSGRKLSSKRLYVGTEDRAGDVRNEGLGYCEPKTGLVQYEKPVRKNPHQSMSPRLRPAMSFREPWCRTLGNHPRCSQPVRRSSIFAMWLMVDLRWSVQAT